MADESRQGSGADHEKGNGRKGGAQKDATGKWVAVGAGMGIGSAALVAALLYARKSRAKTEPERPSREPAES